VAGIMREQRRLARLTREQLEADKLRRFRELVRLAQQRSPYYADIIKTRGLDPANCVPTDFPVLTKALLMANFDRIVTDRRITKQGIADFLTRSTDPNDFLLGEYRVLHTSGTSGEVGYFVYSQADWYRGMFAGGRRERPATRYKRSFGRMRFGFYGATGGHFAGVSMAKSAEHGLTRLFMKVGIFEVNSPLPQVIAQLNRFQPQMLMGYTNALKVLAARQATGELRIAPLAIAAGGETVTANDRAIIGGAFGCDVTSAYACTEHLMMGASDPDGEHMTLYDDNLIYEFFDDHSLVTNLFNATLPLIRYRMSDILQPVTNTSGSRHLKIRNLIGRTELVPKFLNDDGAEDFVSPHTINEIFVAGVTKFQLHVTGPKTFTFFVCLDPSLDAAARARALAVLDTRLREILAQKKMSSVRHTIEVRDSIDADPHTRKFRLITVGAGALTT
jgi:phenylacetate-coenzyme A ligase PaaK-like adenylate-forming protein